MAAADCVATVFHATPDCKWPTATRFAVRYQISILQLRWAEVAEVEVRLRPPLPTIAYPPPESAHVIYGKEAKTIIAFLLLLFFQG